MLHKQDSIFQERKPQIFKGELLKYPYSYNKIHTHILKHEINKYLSHARISASRFSKVKYKNFMFDAVRSVSIFSYVNYRVLHISWPKICNYIFLYKIDKLIFHAGISGIRFQYMKQRKLPIAPKLIFGELRVHISYEKIYPLISNMK